MRDRTIKKIAEMTSDPTAQELALRMSLVRPQLLPAGIETLEQIVRFVELAPDESREKVELFESIRSAETLNNALGIAQLWFK